MATKIPTGYGYEILWLLLFSFTVMGWLGCIAILLQHLTNKQGETKP
jgi:hypothetical protein